ncbi:MAG: putative glycolipid-binding domain-containing protein [Gordonia amarae]
MSSPQAAQQSPTTSAATSTSPGGGEFRTMVTWRGLDAIRLEQVRLYVSGARIKAYGRIIAAAHDDKEAFSASYELITNDEGVTKRFSVHLVRASGESQLAINRDGEHNWLVQTADGTIRSDFNGAEDIDMALSPMFNALPIRRYAFRAGRRVPAGEHAEVPVVYLYLPEARVEAATMKYTKLKGNQVSLEGPVASSTVTFDENGFVINYEGLSERV